MLDKRLKAFLSHHGRALVLATALGGALAWSSDISARTPADHTPPGTEVAGPARVTDGDTITIGDVRIRLEGIDAPEAGQTCRDRKARDWPCGTQATNELSTLVKGRDIRCDRRGHDKYGRMLGICFAGSTDLSAEMVRRGLAWAFVKYSTTYASIEAGARAAKIGIWQGEALPAWDFRAQRWTTAEAAAPGKCVIKGNVTRNGRIYHTPWSPWYDKVRMQGEGKRWFCSEAEALAAGWRPAQFH